MTQQILVGTVGPARGLRGEVLVRPHTDMPEQRFAPGQALSTQDGRELAVNSLRYIKNRWCLTFEGIDSRELAEGLRGIKLYAERVDESDSDAFYDDQLRGCEVVDTRSRVLGSVAAIESGLAQDLLVVLTPSESVRVPFVKALVPRVDVAARRVVVDPPEGMFGAADD